ncbi:hypothetical protein PG997_013370 [Apiospora hydei]|uniref:Uncharacterized protein n=1 Tax=Apiospora hydei TaxID=1337664 RepID=A0ABR1V616_9PEZI
MPGFAGLIKRKASTSAFCQSLLSKLRHGSSSCASKDAQSNTPAPYAPFRGKHSETRRGRSYYYEMDETSLVRETQFSAAHDHKPVGKHLAEDERGILKTTNLAQSHERPSTHIQR